MNRFFLCLVLVLSINLQARADVYKYEDPDGKTEFLESPTDDSFKVFVQPVKKQEAAPHRAGAAEPIPSDYLFNSASVMDGSVWAVRKTNVRNKYYWYMGVDGKTLVTVKGKKVYVGAGYVYYIKDNDVVMSDRRDLTVLVRGSLGYYCYTRTMLDAMK